jgi:hypothetical protein
MNLPLVSMREALRRPEYFGAVLAGDSWANWRVLLVAIAGEGLDEAEAGAFKGLSGRTGAPTEAAREFWAVCLAVEAARAAQRPSWPPG